MTQKTKNIRLAEKRATALRENLKRRKEAQHQQDKKTEKK